MTEPQPYRVFICYAHENEKELKLVVEHLQGLGVTPRWSGTLQAGSPFPGQIKEGISRAHLFLPILTETANARTWPPGSVYLSKSGSTYLSVIA